MLVFCHAIQNPLYDRDSPTVGDSLVGVRPSDAQGSLSDQYWGHENPTGSVLIFLKILVKSRMSTNADFIFLYFYRHYSFHKIRTTSSNIVSPSLILTY